MRLRKARGLGRTMNYPGRLFIVEGNDGSGKSTQIYLLKRWLEEQGYPVFFTEWNSSELIKAATKKAKKKNLLTPTTFSLIHASDFADRYEKMMLPHLRAGYIVLADRYVYTAYARDMARGCDPDWVKNVYSFAVKPTISFYFKTPLEVSLDRILSSRPQLKYHEAGLDLGLSNDPVESFKLFQGMIKSNYDSMIEEEHFMVIDATKSVEKQQQKVRKAVMDHLRDYVAPSVSQEEQRA
ncbi:MAG: dTMP kinase [Acidibacillus sp.]|uniref:Thymidylate kinase n=1 Tax=Sulfoacidibacillus ferrooxidans TaxID=2005001 RepID=A0A9X1V8F0_9BACL|nr:dTMP kinase [Sulfoacidibacillus ferrooxidans]MCI0182839.1 Thymidylate kinase [Sulfoacidibacillus ferrooxidans]MCY0893261.1 dTMP kinase [Acidibacillus sp.]